MALVPSLALELPQPWVWPKKYFMVGRLISKGAKKLFVGLSSKLLTSFYLNCIWGDSDTLDAEGFERQMAAWDAVVPWILVNLCLLDSL